MLLHFFFVFGSHLPYTQNKMITALMLIIIFPTPALRPVTQDKVLGKCLLSMCLLDAIRILRVFGKKDRH